MGILVALHHATTYSYDRLIQLGPQVIRLRPAPHARTPIQSYSLKIEPKHFINWQQDPFGNYLARVIVPDKTRSLTVQVDLLAEIRVFNPFDFFLEDQAKNYPFRYEDSLAEELSPYLKIKEEGPKLLQFMKSIGTANEDLVVFLSGLNQRLSQELGYLVRMEPGVQSCEQTLGMATGSCRDMAWLLCQILRHLGFATRFASGYLIQLKADVAALDGPSGTDHDFTDLHAWTEVFLPGAGWVGLDPTSGLFTGEGHIPLCCSPDPSSAAPITGTIESNCRSELDHKMTITRISEARRITKPYTDNEWSEINQVGERVDRDLIASDARLTMGGEPTFVALDDQESPEWNTAALGEGKWERANDLLARLWEKFGTGGFLQHGQGKWYPGEGLPRWALGCYWRKDGKTLWNDRKLLSVEEPAKSASTEDAKTFISELSVCLGLSAGSAIAAYEDAPYYLWKEGTLPTEGDIFKVNLFEKTERQRLQKLIQKDLNSVTGYVLPLGFAISRESWVTNSWEFRNNRLLLTIGNSPLGFRLPMDSIPYIEESEEDFSPEKSPFEPAVPLDSREMFLAKIEKRAKSTPAKPSTAGDPFGYVRTALCVEPRDGFLYVFLPPVAYAENFLDLLTCVEWTAKKLNLPVRIEGYSPPQDLRLANFKITPDPGVIEVNVQPTSTWAEQVELTSVVYEQARLARLATEKFMLDGRRIGTGGGNHIVVGGATPADSPFLRKPDLIRSMITFWQHHPSLSYLFSSLYIGPTSQSPRIDEARHDSLYELEIAFQKIPAGESVPLWLVDRLLRNLLIDVTGNTHRVEFCIDKLYSPDSETGRLGLLELRAFEMPPHPQMSLVQSLLVRATIAMFWKRPYHHSLIRWGTQLHDRYMLPHFVWSDLKEVIAHLNSGGYSFDVDWFAPLFEFRFPLLGEVQIGDVNIELRTALEPWPVMGEETNQSSVSRGVDSSLERLQIKVRGGMHPHHVVTCNGFPVPLHPTGETDCYVAGVRFKAWAPTSSLHPTIKVHAPLVIDLIDTRYNRSLGGGTYHVAHPGGVNYERPPINENEAEGRRISRFQPSGHTPGVMQPKKVGRNPDFPLTLDLRLT